uniref:Uncharacterized protein n=1 Tax=Timema poppense TaxID=170557 RepID=A0A7R9D748_TIMPO|nr:unnamed protein product [Timema poppensis]
MDSGVRLTISQISRDWDATVPVSYTQSLHINDSGLGPEPTMNKAINKHIHKRYVPPLKMSKTFEEGRGIRRLEEEFTLQVKTWSIRIMKSVFCKTAMVLVAIMVVVLTVPTWARDERYTSKYDDMDVDHILNSDRLTDSYVHCLLEQGPCTPEGKVMKIETHRSIRIMKSVCNTAMALVAVVVVFAVVTLAEAKEERYTSRYDNVDVERILQSARLLDNYMKCLLEKGPCTPDGKEMKNLLPDALKTDCEKCTEKQRTTSQKVMKHLMKTRPDDWAKLTKKYDPEGLYRSRYSALIVDHMSGRA